MKVEALREVERSWFVRTAERLHMGEACQLRRRLAPGLWLATPRPFPRPNWPSMSELEAMGRLELGAWSAGLERKQRRALRRRLGALPRSGSFGSRERLSPRESESLESCLVAPWRQDLSPWLRAGLHRLVRHAAPGEPDRFTAWLAAAPEDFQPLLRMLASLGEGRGSEED